MIPLSRRRVLDITFPATWPFQVVTIDDITYCGSCTIRAIPSRVVAMAFNKNVPWMNLFELTPLDTKSEAVESVRFVHFVITLEGGRIRRPLMIESLCNRDC